MIVHILPFGSAQQIQSVGLRVEVLRKPLGMQFNPEDLSSESEEWHIGAIVNNRVVGCMILKPVDAIVKMRQVAVADDYQGKGVGKAMVAFAEEHCLNHGIKSIQLHARETAIPFYISQGYDVISEEFYEVGIPHKAMKKDLLRDF